MACPTPIPTGAWQVPGWNPSQQQPNQPPQAIIPPSSIVPSGAAVVFIQLSVEGPNQGDAVFPSDPNGNQVGNPVRVQTPGVYNDALAFAPMDGNAFYIRNASHDELNVWVTVLGYA